MREGRIKILQAGHHRVASEMPFKGQSVSLAFQWWPNIEYWHGSFIIFQGNWTSIAKKQYFYVFQGGSGLPTPLPPPGSAHVCNQIERFITWTSVCNLALYRFSKLVYRCILETVSGINIHLNILIFLMLSSAEVVLVHNYSLPVW